MPKRVPEAKEESYEEKPARGEANEAPSSDLANVDLSALDLSALDLSALDLANALDIDDDELRVLLSTGC